MMSASLQCGGGIGRDRRAGGGVIGIGDAGARAGARLDHHVQAEALELLDGFRGRGDARLARPAFLRDRKPHGT